MKTNLKYIYSVGVFALLLGTGIACTEEEPISMAPTFRLNEVSDIMRTTAKFSGSISGDMSNIKEYGFQYSLSEDFTANLTQQVIVGETPASSSCEAVVSGLEANERYYYRLYATTGASKVYSEAEYFQTAASSAPLLTNLLVDSIGENMARFRCTVEDIGDEYLIEYGVGYKTITDKNYIPISSDSIIPGTNNTFFVEINGLEPATKYSFRPYAKNSTSRDGSTGSREGYGSVIDQQTESLLSADVTTIEIADGNIGINSILVSGRFNSAAGSNGVINSCGFCWSENNMLPVITDDTLALAPVKTGEIFYATIKDLKPKTLYYVRAYATNTVNGVERVGYGEVYEVTTGGLATPKVEQEYEDDGYGGQMTTYETTATSIHFKALITNYDANALVEKGFIWSEVNGSITLDEAKKNNTYLSLDLNTGGKSIDSTIQNLKMDTRYYVRAYAVYRAEGIEVIGYSNSEFIRTNSFEAPNLAQAEIKDVTRNSATLVGGMSSKGNGTINEKGFVISKYDDTYRPELTTKGVIVLKSDDDSFTEMLTGLEYQTSYAVRTYAIAELAERVDTVYAWYTFLRTASLNGPTFKQMKVNLSSDTLNISTGLDEIGDGKIVEKGFYWRIDTVTSEFILPNCQSVVAKGNDDDFSALITGLKFQKGYNVGSYVKSFVDGDTVVYYGNTAYQYISFSEPDIWTISLNTDYNEIECEAEIRSAGDGKIVEKGFLWRKDGEDVDFNLENCDYAKAEDAEEGKFVYTITGLDFSTRYNVRCYVKSLAGNDTITTLQGGWSNPSTNGVQSPNNIELTSSSITSLTVESGIEEKGGIEIVEKGFVWLKDPKDGYWKNPTLEDNPDDANDGMTDSKKVTDKTNDVFSLEITGLDRATTYYVRAYVKVKHNGKDYIIYSNSQYYTTQDYNMPNFGYLNIERDSIGLSTAVLQGNVNNWGNLEVVKKGFVIHLAATTNEPSLNNKLYQVDVQGDEFVATLKGLAHGTRYSVRAFATCKVGDNEETTYSPGSTFDTKLPTVSTFNNLVHVSDSTTVNSLYFTCGIGEVGDGTLMEKGFIWKMEPEGEHDYWQYPSFEDDPENENDGYTDYKSVESDSIQNFSLKITDLKPSKLYFVRAYAKVKVEDEVYNYYSDLTDVRTQSVQTMDMKSVEYVASSLSSITVKSGISRMGTGEVVEKGFLWAKGSEDGIWKYPSFEDDPENENDGYTGYKAVTDGTEDEFSLEVTGLSKSTAYYLRAYAKMIYDGKTYVSYSGVLRSYTQDNTLPSFKSLSIPNDSIGFSSALLQSGFNSLGNLPIVKKGFVVHLAETTNEPSVGNKLYEIDVKGDTLTAKITGLSHNTRYSVRAFATCKVGEGEETAYSSSREFTTDRPQAPTFNNLKLDSVSVVSLHYTCGIGEVKDGKVVEKGFIWKERPKNNNYWQYPSFEDRSDDENDGNDGYQAVMSDSLQEYSVNITGLKPSTTYFVRSYAKVKVEDVEYVYYSGLSNNATNQLSVGLSFTATVDSCLVTGTVTDLPEGVEKFGVCYALDTDVNTPIDDMTATVEAVKASDFDESGAFTVGLGNLESNEEYKVGFYFIYKGEEIRLNGEWWFNTKRTPSINDNVSPGKKEDE